MNSLIPFDKGGIDGFPQLSRENVEPNADIYETPEAYVLSLDMPGARKEGISVTVEKGVLQVEADVADHHDKQAKILLQELSTASYARKFALGEGVDMTSVDAHYQDGILTIKLFKKPAIKPRTITIN